MTEVDRAETHMSKLQREWSNRLNETCDLSVIVSKNNDDFLSLMSQGHSPEDCPDVESFRCSEALLC